MKKILLVLAIAGVMVSCSGATTTTGEKATTTNEITAQKELIGTTWRLEKYSVDRKLVDVIGNSKANILFQEDRFSGNGSVNRYFGSYNVDGNNIKMGAVGSTMMMGPKEASDQEFAYTELLGKATSWEIIGDRLTLLEDSKVILVFKASL
jgi:heat shock protein HslJ